MLILVVRLVLSGVANLHPILVYYNVLKINKHLSIAHNQIFLSQFAVSVPFSLYYIILKCSFYIFLTYGSRKLGYYLDMWKIYKHFKNIVFHVFIFSVMEQLFSSETYTGTPCFIVFHFIVFHRYCTFYKLKLCGNPVSNKSIGAIFSNCTSHFVSLCHILVILTIFQTFFILTMLWWSLISEL